MSAFIDGRKKRQPYQSILKGYVIFTNRFQHFQKYSLLLLKEYETLMGAYDLFIQDKNNNLYEKSHKGEKFYSSIYRKFRLYLVKHNETTYAYLVACTYNGMKILREEVKA
ncbi:TPA: hypothetical protein VBX77_002487 [Yersinia enterocolitica]|nr:hypothetical protein [Yersinia enterocolitica]